MKVATYANEQYLYNKVGYSHVYCQVRLCDIQPKPLAGNVLFGAKKIPCTYVLNADGSKIVDFPEPACDRLTHCKSDYFPEDSHQPRRKEGEMHFSIHAFADPYETMDILKDHPDAADDFYYIMQQLEEAKTTYDKHALFLFQTHMLVFIRSLYGNMPLRRFYRMHVDDLLQHVLKMLYGGPLELMHRRMLRKAPLSVRSEKEVVEQMDDSALDNGEDEADCGGGIDDSEEDSCYLTMDFFKLMELRSKQVDFVEESMEEAEQRKKQELNKKRAKELRRFMMSDGDDDDDDRDNDSDDESEKFKSYKRQKLAVQRILHPVTKVVLASTDPSDILLGPYDVTKITHEEWLQLFAYSVLWESFLKDKNFYILPNAFYVKSNRCRPSFECSNEQIHEALLNLAMQAKVVICSADTGKPILEEDKIIEAFDNYKWESKGPLVSLVSVFRQEMLIFNGIANLLERPYPLSLSDALESHEKKSRRAMAEINTYLLRSGVDLDDRQQLALDTYKTQRFLALQGRGGTGKTFITGILAYYSRLVDGRKDAVYLFTGFTNNSVNKLRDVIMNHPLNKTHKKPLMTNDNCHFLTMDHLLYRYILRKKRPEKKYRRVFLDEAAMACTRNLNSVFSIIDCSESSVVMSGDFNQLSAISAGNNFEDFVTHLTKQTIHLEYVHRTSQLCLKASLDAILAGDLDGIISDASEERSFELRYSFEENVYFRDRSCLKICAAECWQILNELDPTRSNYRNVQLISPFRWITKLLTLCSQRYYIHGEKDIPEDLLYAWITDIKESNGGISSSARSSVSTALSSSSLRSFDLQVNSKVVFLVTNKTDKYNRPNNNYCNGYSGFVTQIIDVDSEAHPDDYGKPGQFVSQVSTHVPIPYKHKRVITVDDKYVVEFRTLTEMNSVLQPADALTVDKSQCQEYDTVICFFPFSGKTLNEQNRLYTACSRAKKQCILVTSRVQLRNMLNNKRVLSNSFLRVFLSTRYVVDDPANGPSNKSW